MILQALDVVVNLYLGIFYIIIKFFNKLLLYSHLYGEQGRFFEMEMIPKLKHTRKGLVSMVNNGNNMLGSQFYITLDDNLDYLDGKHCIFGQVTEGLDTVQKINEELVDENNFPFNDIRYFKKKY